MCSNHYETFFDAIAGDPRIRITHVAVFAALYSLWIKTGCEPELKVFSEQVMSVAKISSRITYCKVIIDLNEFGYLKYCPSFFGGKASSIRLTISEEKMQRVWGQKKTEGAVGHG
ncbi:hypothetical protein [Pedobacter sp. B4-66]|uniref:hypothetical protein n=1 Tax=Pedobacter sp. B4-66 TaxID=2817280 RepID=UPI001BDA5E6E|nr:hypothetical protein [Pedobacter sp. B4-66]